MVRVEGDFQRLDFSVLCKVLLECFRGHVLRDLSNEDVVVNNLLRVRSEKVIVVGEGSAGLAFSELEVSELLACLLELVFLGDGHDGRVEGSVDVSSNLWNPAEDDAGLLLEVSGEFGGRGDVLGEVVDVKVVLSAVGGVNHLHGVVLVVFLFGFVGFLVVCLF